MNENNLSYIKNILMYQGEPRTLQGFLKTMAHYNGFGLYLKLIYLIVIQAVEVKSTKTLENFVV